MSRAPAVPRESRRAPLYLSVHPVSPHGSDTWLIRLEPGLLTLLAPGDVPVIQLHQDEAARYMRFTRDLFRGRILSFVLIEGLKAYTFRSTAELQSKLLDWLPRKSEAQARRESRMASVALGLCGVLHFLAPPVLVWQWGGLLCAVALLGLAHPRRRQYALNGAVLLVAGLWYLFAPVSDVVDPRMLPPGLALLNVAVGSLLILWGIQQLTLLGVNNELRSARSVRDARAAFLPGASRLVRRTSSVGFGAAAVLALYTAAVAALRPVGAADAIPVGSMADWLTPDVLFFGSMALLLALIATVCRLWKSPPAYLEAKLALQLLATVVVLCTWNALSTDRRGAAEALFGNVLADIAPLTRPAPWFVLICVVLVMNRWFTALVDRELEEQRG